MNTLTKADAVARLTELGYAYESENHYGIDAYEEWYKHPSGAALNLDSMCWHRRDYLQRKLDRAPHSIRIHEFEQKATAAAKAYAEAKGMYARRHYYLGSDENEMDWLYRIDTKQFGTTLEYKRGKDFLPEEYEKVADSFRVFAPQ